MKSSKSIVVPPIYPWSDRRLRILKSVRNNGPLELLFLHRFVGLARNNILEEDVGFLIREGYLVEKDGMIHLAYVGAWRKYQLEFLSQSRWYVTTLLAVLALVVSIIGLFL